MTVKVEIPSIFARYAGNRTTFETGGKTVGESIKDLGKRYPDLVKLILTKDGRLLNSIAIFINGENAYPEAVARPVKDGDKIKVVMLIQGG
jgi:molybdopterin converting factor small subunit